MSDLMESAGARLLGIADHDDNDLSPNDQRLLRALAEREPLVQEVIRLQQAFEAAVASDDLMTASGISDELNEALHKLAEWKP